MQKLKDYLRLHEIQQKEFAKALGVTRQTLYFILEGKKKIHQLQLAYKIEQLTNGHVLVYDFLEEDLIKSFEQKDEDLKNKDNKELDYLVVGKDELGEEIWLSLVEINNFLSLAMPQNSIRKFAAVYSSGSASEIENEKLNLLSELRSYLNHYQLRRRNIAEARRKRYETKTDVHVWDCSICEKDGKNGLHFFIKKEYSEGLFIDFDDKDFLEKLDQFCKTKEWKYGRKI